MKRASAVVLCALLLAAGCSDPQREPGSADPLAVVASVYPLAEVAQRVGGERVEVTNLTPPGVEPHDLELTTAQADAILDADLVLYLGAGFQPAIEETVQRSEGQALDLLDEVDPISGGHDHDHEQEEDEGSIDPHVWLDPRRMSDIVTRIEEALAEADPDGRAGYAERAEAYRTELKGLDEAFSQGLADCDRDLIVTNHASFGYLADRYGLEQEAVTGLAPGSEPDPRRLAELSDLVRRRGVTTVFTETLADPRVAETLAREAGVRTAVLDPIEGLSDEQVRAGRSYVTVMADNLAALRTALGCR
ncbi:MAG TPA: metal ABC transporter substrate-binding protein [Actinomycetota bacterium]|nr:metal ABC transporter substrate-binding protein [Actinomycetota bacterium]